MSLQPPRIDTTDPNQQDISEDSDHFSSASEGHSHLHPHAPPSPNSLSPENVPITRVERVDDSARHGEVPGTPAYEMRLSDAVPDEIEIVPEGRRSRAVTIGSQPRSRSHSQLSTSSRPATPGGTPIPKTVVEKVDNKPSYGEVEGTPAKEMRMADAIPDEVRPAPASASKRLEGRSHPNNPRYARGVDADDETEEGRQAWFRSMWESDQQEQEQEEPVEEAAVQDADDEEDEEEEEEEVEDDFGDDFDEFAEGGEGDEDFGDFDEADDEPAPSQPPPSQLPATPDVLEALPPLNLSACTTPDEIREAMAPYINAILPNSSPILTTEAGHSRAPSMADTSPFLSDRSLSLWQQLVSPPPMQPPNWTRSRIRRLFLVSLGVPVDLDEILPPSKQKRLVLPSIGLDDADFPTSTHLQRLKESEANDSATSIDSKTGESRPSRKSRDRPTKRVSKVPPPPVFDTLAAARLAATTEQALSVFTDGELQEHVLTLRVLNEDASRVLEYWLQRKDDGIKEKEALEGVIENLVGWVKGGRGATGKGGKGR